MNSNQVASIVNSLLKILGAFLTTHGYTAASALLGLPAVGQEITGIAVVILGLILSHYQHSSPDSGSASNLGQKLPVVFLVSIGLGALLFTGCVGNPPTKIYKAVGTTDATVTAAVKAWDVYVTNNTVPVSQQLAVKAAFQKVQAAEILVLDADAAYAQYGSTNAPAGIIAQSQAAAVNASTALNDLLALLAQFNIKL